MKKVNVRFTDEEHELLVARAQEGRRSLQRQIVFELFNGGLSERERPGESALTSAGRTDPGLREPLVPSVPARSESPRPVTALLRLQGDCQNSDYHWKLKPGEACRFCKGTA